MAPARPLSSQGLSDSSAIREDLTPHPPVPGATLLMAMVLPGAPYVEAPPSRPPGVLQASGLPEPSRHFLVLRLGWGTPWPAATAAPASAPGDPHWASFLSTHSSFPKGVWEVLITRAPGGSLVVPWLGQGAFTVMTQLQSLVRELRCPKLRS